MGIMEYHGLAAMEVSGVHISAGNAADPDLTATYPNPTSRTNDERRCGSQRKPSEVKEQLDQVMWLVVIVEPILSDE